MNKFAVFAIAFVVVAGAFFLIKSKSFQVGESTINASPQSTNSAMLGGDLGLDVRSSDISYFENARGFFAIPTAEGVYPGVVMIHEWWGLNENIRDMARQLAAQGYQVLAVDLYGGKVAKDATEARQFVSSIDEAKAVENMQAAVAYLRSQGASKVASLGWCFGGGQSLQLAISGVSLDATVIYYGQLETDQARLLSLRWPVLGIFGGEDQSIATETVNQFDKALDNLRIENEIYIYPGVGHAFANPSGQNYALNETKDAWGKTLAFLQRTLKS